MLIEANLVTSLRVRVDAHRGEMEGGREGRKDEDASSSEIGGPDHGRGPWRAGQKAE